MREYEYDALMRLTRLVAKDPGGNSILDYSYEYDHTGNIVSKTTEHGTYSYGYDGASRLTSVENPTVDDESYSYDAVGNRTNASNANGSITHNANNELTMYGEVEYVYDANGNMTEVTLSGQIMFSYHYNADNRLVKVEGGNSNTIAEYYYDPFGRRLWKDANQTRTYFFYSDEGLIAEFDVSGSELRSYGYKPDSTWTTDPLWMNYKNAYYFYHNDHLGTPQKLTAQNGMVVWSTQYSAFGEADIQVETITNTLRFPGQYEDEETGLHYNRHRYYDPGIGRYISADPIGFGSGEVNLYVYAGNTPTIYIDPYGLLTGVGLDRLKYTYDEESCQLNVTMKWCVNFTNYKGEGPWSKVEQENWKREAETILEDYFNNIKYRCYPSAPNCQRGVDIAFDLIFIESEYIVDISCGLPSACYDVMVDYNRTPATKFRAKASISGAWLNRTDLEPKRDPLGVVGPNDQITVVHETGHMLGLPHPGQRLPAFIRPKRGSLADYTVDQDSLMGLGMQLCKQDFQEAFCDHIPDNDCEL